MSRLYNLDSYLQFCHYSKLFEKEDQPNSDYLSFQALACEHGSTAYLPLTPLTHLQTEMLERQDNGSQLTTMGDPILGTQKKYLVPDHIDLLTLSNSLKAGEDYLYKSAYYYWCHAERIRAESQGKPIIIINLDGWEIKNLVPFRLEEHLGQWIPILDPRNRLVVDPEINLIECHNKFYQSLAQYIVDKYVSELESKNLIVSNLADYLKKIDVLKLIDTHQIDASVEIIVELSTLSEKENYPEIIYKSIHIEYEALQKAFRTAFSVESIKHFLQENNQYCFFIVTQYTTIGNLEEIIDSKLILDLNHDSFLQVLSSKEISKFPLFGIDLDRLEFGIRRNEEQQWIELVSRQQNISYEGRQLDIRGELPEVSPTYFTINTKQDSVLPIRVNNRDYNKSFLINVLSDERPVESISVELVFSLTPGQVPTIRVNDISNRYKIRTSLVPRHETPRTHIRISDILRTRRADSESRSRYSNFKFSDIENNIVMLHNSLNNFTNDQFIERYRTSPSRRYISRVAQDLKGASSDYLQEIEPESESAKSNESLQNLISLLSSIQYGRLLDIIFSQRMDFGSKNNIAGRKNIAQDIFSLTGKLYKYSYIFDYSSISAPRKVSGIVRLNSNIFKSMQTQFFFFLARTAHNVQSQETYFELFNECHSNSQYMWGYGRILRWYYDFSRSNFIFDYKAHTIALLQLLFELERRQEGYPDNILQNIFLSLVYLLTFRQNDKTFYSEDSLEKDLATRVVDLYDTIEVKFSKVGRLDSLYREMIQGTASADLIEALLQVD